ncbi:MAG: acetyl-CoA carboxylase biotin carboxyl carrier protein subunit, partial [Chloroflexi bacterium]|nr:acetyl-CoA carboxylase biotin carboxyl carrier protein subunit [Chloroflexota bacterium]
MVSTYEITVNGETFVVEVDLSTSPATVVVNGQPRAVTFRQLAAATASPAPAAAPAPTATAPAPAPKPEPKPAAVPAGTVPGEVVKAPMPGKILSILVQVGSNIKEGQTVCTLEAMKMEMPISATASGTVKAIHVSVGDTVAY